MKRPTHQVVLILLILAVSSAAYSQDRKPKSFLSRLFTGSDLPIELTKDVDVFRARFFGPGNPYTFRPFKMTDFKSSVGRRESEEQDVAQDRHYSFTMNESGQPQWDCRCEWWGMSRSPGVDVKTIDIDTTLLGEIKLHCDFLKPAGEKVWSLDLKLTDRLRGLWGLDSAIVGRLFSESGEFKVELLKGLGDVPDGYIFKAGDTAVAAVDFRGSKIIVHRSVAAADRSLLVAATAAIRSGERYPD